MTDLRTLLAAQLAVYACGDPHDVPESLWKDIKTLFSDREIVDLVFMIGFYSGNQIMNILWGTERLPQPAVAGDAPR